MKNKDYNLPFRNGKKAEDLSVLTGQVSTLNSSLADKAKKRIADVRDYGAKGDGITDDTTAIQTAINSSLAVEFPNTGNYYKTNKLTLRANGVYFGNGVIQSSTPPSTVIDIPYNANNITISDLSIVGWITIGSTGGSAGNLTNNISIKNCNITGGITSSRVNNVVVDGNNIKNGTILFNDLYDRIRITNNVINNDISYGTQNAIGGGANYTEAGTTKTWSIYHIRKYNESLSDGYRMARYDHNS
jgi:hypothetical protein